MNPKRAPNHSHVSFFLLYNSPFVFFFRTSLSFCCTRTSFRSTCELFTCVMERTAQSLPQNELPLWFSSVTKGKVKVASPQEGHSCSCGAKTIYSCNCVTKDLRIYVSISETKTRLPKMGLCSVSFLFGRCVTHLFPVHEEERLACHYRLILWWNAFLFTLNLFAVFV